jgi:cytochrome c-type biogenesis protein
MLMRLLRLLAFTVVAILVMRPSGANAFEPIEFTPQAFAAAQAANKPILLFFDASWCSTCSVERPIIAGVIDELEKSRSGRNLEVFTVDWDSQQDVAMRFNVPTQSTLVVFQGKTEKGRLTGETDPNEISALLKSPWEERVKKVETRLASIGGYFLALFAGALSILSPCCLAVLPIVIASAAAAHRWGALALAAGLALSYTVIGLFLATIGYSLGLTGNAFRIGAAILMVLFGAVLLSGSLQERFALAGSGLGNTVSDFMSKIQPSGLQGQFVVGALLGVVWSPCVGPIIGAAATLASQRQALGQVALAMALFGIGAALPLVIIGTLSREALMRWRGRMSVAGHAGKAVLGIFLVIAGIAIMSGIDRRAQTVLARLEPNWMHELATKF